ncbi:MAG: hypothetical protein Q8J76_00150, partial [Desulfobulbaceae bacterium]|nr:hypothetical protein [Desulfobulbaceae bacterium]
DNFTMGPADALRAVEFIKPKQVIPIHFSTFPVIRQDPLAWAAKVEEVTAVQVVILTPGTPFVLS